MAYTGIIYCIHCNVEMESYNEKTNKPTGTIRSGSGCIVSKTKSKKDLLGQTNQIKKICGIGKTKTLFRPRSINLIKIIETNKRYQNGNRKINTAN